MSHYEFLQQLLPIVYLHSPIKYEDGTFSVEVDDAEGWNSTTILFDKDGNYLDRS